NKKSTFGHDLSARLEIGDVNHPMLNLDLDGQLPLTLLNLVASPSLEVESGKADFDHFRLHHFDWRGDVIQQWLKSSKPDFTIEDLKCTYLGNKIICTSGTIHSSGEGAAQFEVKDLGWNKAAARAVKGEIKNASPDQWDFSFGGEMSGGKIESKGFIRLTNQSYVWQADWTIKDVDMRDVMTSFSDFDQTFITAENLSGKADIWATTTIPMDPSWKIQTKQVFAEAALDIRDGQIKNLKTLEDFSKYVHIEDLRDIRFSELRNYLKIENGQVFLPVMFIQSSAMNLSISGVHAFDQKILYNLKINAGQTLANKFRKTDFRKEMKPARKSGWINLYFVLEGSTTDVKYQQYRQAVLSGFEQSAKLKETLRKSLVDRFGYDVYWLEPNEWEEIPEYK
ncbi:MAG TPA: AsmA-like C-terminal region-containing protein, partial [Saprospiraceae bacterium]|nr:AsmA-like C-terminal region-containing protein [Saprospiraceae bacterium]